MTLSTPASNSQTSFDWEVFSIGRSADLAVKCDMEIKYTGKLLLVIVQNIVSKLYSAVRQCSTGYQLFTIDVTEKCIKAGNKYNQGGENKGCTGSGKNY